MEETSVIINVQNGKSYPVYISVESIHDLKQKLDMLCGGKKRLVVISEKVHKLYKNELNFNKNELFILKDGENKKNLKTFEKIIKRAISLKLSRKDMIIALGGGVTGDIAGFVSASYMRGIDYIQVPTTLLACVDSSVGGKTAIDMPCGKNYVGAFYQPKAVYINLNFLKTLDNKQYKSGFGEILKYAFIEKSCLNDEYYNLLEILKNNPNNYKKRDMKFLLKIIVICLKLKASVVNKDEKEENLRKILNFGHTFGHALEEATQYKRYTHGYGVMLGIMFAFNMARKNGICARQYYDEAFSLIGIYEYKTDNFLFVNKKKVLKLMKNDKKNVDNMLVFILPSKTGEVVEYKAADFLNSEFDLKYIPPIIDKN